MKNWPYTKGLHELGAGNYAYLVPDGSWGWSNAGLVTDAGQTLLVDTLFDLRLTGEMLAAMRRAVPAAAGIGALVNTHANGDHTFGNQMVEGARIIASKAAAEDMPNRPRCCAWSLLPPRPPSKRGQQTWHWPGRCMPRRIPS